MIIIDEIRWTDRQTGNFVWVYLKLFCSILKILFSNGYYQIQFTLSKFFFFFSSSQKQKQKQIVMNFFYKKNKKIVNKPTITPSKKNVTSPTLQKKKMLLMALQQLFGHAPFTNFTRNFIT